MNASIINIVKLLMFLDIGLIFPLSIVNGI